MLNSLMTTEVALIAASGLSFVAICMAGCAIAARRARRATQQQIETAIAAQEARLVDAIDAIGDRMLGQGRTVLNKTAALATATDQIQTDVSWLAGERMIDQAVMLAKSGVQSDDILRETGLTASDVETIVRFRKH